MPAVSISCLPRGWKEVKTTQKVACIAQQWNLVESGHRIFTIPDIGNAGIGRAELQHIIGKNGSPEVDALLWNPKVLQKGLLLSTLSSETSIKASVDAFKRAHFHVLVDNVPIAFHASLQHNTYTDEWRIHHLRKE